MKPLAATQTATLLSPLGTLIAQIQKGSLQRLDFARASGIHTPLHLWYVQYVKGPTHTAPIPDRALLNVSLVRFDDLTRANLKTALRICRLLTAFFNGTPPRYKLSYSMEGTSFQQSIWHAMADIRYGSTLTYGELASRAGKPRAVRAAATACKQNPLLLLIPCHRVVSATHFPGKYRGGIVRKRILLAWENYIKAYHSQ